MPELKNSGFDYDIIIIGAATSGSYFAKKMAEKGFKVVMLEEKDETKLGTKMDIFHVSESDFKKFDIPSVRDGDPSKAFHFTDNHYSSPSDKYMIKQRSDVVGLHLPEYTALMLKAALMKGAEVVFNARFQSFIFKNGKISGVEYSNGDGVKKITSRVVIDCSGIAAVGRCSLPDGYGVETFRLKNEDMFFVILRYCEFKEPQVNTFRFDTKSWCAPYAAESNKKIIGIGAVGGYDKAKEGLKKLDAFYPPESYELKKTELGTTPNCRPPYSFVADGFIVSGDAACLTKPDCGEGVTSSMVMIDISVPILEKALKNGDCSAASLWDINRQYNLKQGAEFAMTRAFLTKAVRVKDEEIEYCFKKGIIFNDGLSEGKINIPKTVAKLSAAVIKGHISLTTITSAISGAALGMKLKKHYLSFPSSPDGLSKWSQKADVLWKKVGKMI
ncbi:MAG: FAD-dependent oxidoreductase [Clostridiales bacterium]|nr:FAD-dependent oxidoreductase [Clostridiales bacterium]